MKAPSAEVVELFGLRELDLKDPLDRDLRLVMNEIDRAFMKYSFETPLFWSDRTGSHAHHVTGIGLNRSEAERIIEEFGDRWRPLVYTTILAHEKAHLIQFREYGHSPFVAHPVRVSEIQADIIAGAYVIVGLLMPHMEQVGQRARANGLAVEYVVDYTNRFMADLVEVIPDIMKSMGELGVSWDIHPTPDQRIRAFYEGLHFQNLMLRSSHPLYDKDLWSFPDSVSHLVPDKITEKEFRDETDLRPNEDFLHWTLRKAYQIAELPFVETSELVDPREEQRDTPSLDSAVRTEVVHQEWNPKQEGGPMEFGIKLLNVTSRPLKCKLIVETGFVPRSKDVDRIYKRYASCEFDVSLPPRTHQRVDGKLKWWSTPQYMPSWDYSVVETAFTGPAPASTQGASLLLDAAAVNDLAGLRAAIESGIDVNDRAEWTDEWGDTHEGSTALYVAIEQGHEQLAMKLVSQLGADSTLTYEDDGLTALHLAARSDLADLVTFLIRQGNSVSSRDVDGSTPMHTAAYFGSSRSLEALLITGAEIEARDVNRETPLMRGARGNEPGVLRMLLARGADPLARDSDGENALFHAVRGGAVECVTLLLSNGLSKTTRNSDGESVHDVVLDLISRQRERVRERDSPYRQRKLESLLEIERNIHRR